MTVPRAIAGEAASGRPATGPGKDPTAGLFASAMVKWSDILKGEGFVRFQPFLAVFSRTIYVTMVPSTLILIKESCPLCKNESNRISKLPWPL
mgnify:CR=1 FL=1